MFNAPRPIERTWLRKSYLHSFSMHVILLAPLRVPLCIIILLAVERAIVSYLILERITLTFAMGLITSLHQPLNPASTVECSRCIQGFKHTKARHIDGKLRCGFVAPHVTRSVFWHLEASL